MDWDCKIGINEKLPVASSLEGNGDLVETKTGLCHSVLFFFFPMAPRYGEWKIVAHVPAVVKPCLKKVLNSE